MMVIADGQGADRRRLRGWKEIATYFGADERTAKRWESLRGLPVHRVPNSTRPTVFAYEDELSAWLRDNRNISDGKPNGFPVAESAPSADPSVVSGANAETGWALRPRRNVPVLAIVLSLAVVAAAVGVESWGSGREIRVETAAAPVLQPDRTRHVPDPAIRELYLDGVYNLETRTPTGLNRAIQSFSEATSRDPAYAEAFAKLAETYNRISQYTLMPADEAYPRAKAAAERAIALDDQLGSAYAALAVNAFYWSRDFGRAGDLFEQALRLDPASTQTHHWYALAAMTKGQSDIALREIALAQALDPTSRGILANKGLILFHAGRVDEAITILRQLEETEPNLLPPRAYLATIYLDQGRYQDFLREYRTAARLEQNAAALAIADEAEAGFATGGSRGLLFAMLAEQKRQHALGQEPAFKLALTSALLGENTAALDYLDASIRRREQDILGIRVEPALSALRADKRYLQLLHQVGFSPPQ